MNLQPATESQLRTREPTTTEKPSGIDSVAAQCLRDNDGDWVRAAAAMKSLVLEDQKLRDLLTEPLLDSAIWMLVRKASAGTRRAFKASAVVSGSDDVSGSRAIGERAAREWFDYPLRGGLRLGDADAAALKVEIEHHFALAKSNNAMGKFLEEIQRKIGQKMVRDALSNQQLRTIAKKHL